MDRTVYLKIRKGIHLKQNKFLLGVHYLQNSILFAMCFFFYMNQWGWTKFLCVPILATLMFRGFSLMHDAVHRAVSKNRFINDFAGIVAGGFCLLPFEPWRQIHLEHHVWSGNVDKDPVMALVRVFSTWPRTIRALATASWRVWLPVLAIFQYVVFWFHCTKCLIEKKTTKMSAISVLFPISMWIGLSLLLPTEFLLSILVPSVVVYLLAVEVVNFPHHLGLQYLEGDKKMALWDQHCTARTCLYPRWLSRFVAMNFNYHVEHHMFPDVPWYYLDQLHPHVKEALKENYNTDPQFSWILDNRPRTLEDILARYPSYESEKQKAA